MSTDRAVLAQLLAAIRVAADQPAIEWAGPPEPLTGGFWAEMWRIRLAGSGEGLNGDLVARIMPDAEVAAREISAQSFLADSGYPTPRVRLSSGPGSELDRPWMLMDHAAGHTLLAGLSGLSALIGLPRLARDMPQRLARHSVALHMVDPGELDDGNDEILELLHRLLEQTTDVDRRDLSQIARWLVDHRPQSRQRSICHGDLHPFNVLTGPNGDTVLDWSTVRIADPAYDVAYTRLLLGNPPLTAPRVLTPLVTAAGRLLARRFGRAYDKTATTPIDPEQLAWFTGLHALRILTEVGIWRARNELDRHPGHPFILIETTLAHLLSRTTGISTDTFSR